MTALADLSDTINRMTGGNSGTPQHVFSFLDGRIQAAAASAPVAARYVSLWQYNQSDGANGAAPTTVAIPGRATLGAMPLAAPGGGRQQWLLGIEAALSQVGTAFLYDRLLHQGDLSATVTTAQTVGGTLTRYNDAAGSVGNKIWLEIYTIIGTTATTVTASYTNQAGVSGRTTRAVAFGGTGNREAQRMIMLPLQDGDTGVRSVQTVTVAATTDTAGAFGVTIVHLHALSGVSSGYGTTRDLLSGLPASTAIADDACLAWMVFCSATTTLAGMVALHTVES